MALIYCQECGAKISDKADVCINCGCPIKEDEAEEEKKSGLSRFLLLILIASLIVWGYGIISNLSEKDKINVVNGVKQITNEPIIIYNEKEIQVQEDQYKSFLVDLKKPAEISIEYNVISGTNLDIYFMDTDNYSRWRNIINNGTREEIYYNDYLSSFGLSTSSKTYKVMEGTYYIVLDNTDYGATYPPMNLVNDISTLNLLVKVKE